MDNKKVILDAASELFFNNGLDFTMDFLASKLKMSKRTIYSLVGNKESIILEVINSICDDMDVYYNSLIENNNISYLDKFELFLNYPNETMFLTREKYKEIKNTNEIIYNSIVNAKNLFWKKCFDILDAYNDHINATVHCNKDIFQLIYNSSIHELFEISKRDINFDFNQNKKFIINNLISGIISTDSSHFGGLLLQRLLGRFKIGISLFQVVEDINEFFVTPDFDEIFKELKNNNKFRNFIEDFSKNEYTKRLEDTFLERKEISFDFNLEKDDIILSYNFKAIPIRYENYKNVFLSIITDTTDTTNRKQALEISEQKFNLALEQTAVDIWELDIVNNMLYLSDAFTERYGFTTTSFKLGMGMFSQYDIVHPDYSKKMEKFYEGVLQGKKSGECTIKMLDRYRRYQLVKLSYKTIFDNNDKPITAVGVATIVNVNLGVYTMFKQEEKIAQMLKDQLLFTAKYNITDNIVKSIDGKENFISVNFGQTVTYEQIREVILNTVAHEVDYQDCVNFLSKESLLNAFTNNKLYQTINFRRSNEKGVISWLTLTLVFLVEPTSGDEYVFIYILDVDKIYKLELSLPVKAEYDMSTKVYIKDTMKRMINFAISREEDTDGDCAYVIIELNNLSAIKFQYGLEVAEKLLAHYSRVLKICFNSKNIVGRVRDNCIGVFFPIVGDLDALRNVVSDVITMAHDSYLLSNEEQRIVKICASIFVSNLQVANFTYLTEKCQAQLDNLRLLEDETIDCIDNIDEYLAEDKNNLILDNSDDSSNMCNETKEMLGCLMDLYNQVTNLTDYTKIINEILKRANNCYAAYRTSLFLLNDDLDSITLKFEAAMDESIKHDDITYKLDDMPCFKNSYLKKKVEIVRSDTLNKKDGNYYNILRLNNISLLYVVPLVYKTNVVGFIAISNPTDHFDSFNFLKIASNIIVSELEIAKLVYKNKLYEQIDFLTQLYNYRTFRKYINKYKQNILNSFGIACIKITNLRNINLHHGSDYGDVIIKSITKTLLSKFDYDCVFKINSDVFEVIGIDLNYNTFTEKVESAVKEINSISPNLVSIGVTWADSDIDIDVMIVHAEEIMQINSNENNFDVSESNNDETLENLQSAINNNWFTFYLQPKVDLNTDEVVAAEALVRLVHPTYGLIAPSSVIPVLEKYNLVSVIDFYVLDLACKTIKKWQDEGNEITPISINYSRVTLLENGVINKTLDIINKYQIDKSFIQIEITESIGNVEQKIVAELAAKFIEKGISLSLDDFGSEFSSLSTLVIVPFEEVKIDKSVINELTVNNRSKIIVESVISCCKQLNMRTVAEGIETKSQYEEIKRIGCNLGQGYYFSKPIPIEEFENKYLKKK